MLGMGTHFGIPFNDWIGHPLFGEVPLARAAPVIRVCQALLNHGWASTANR